MKKPHPMRRTPSWCVATSLAASLALSLPGAASARTVTLMTWNMEWLITPETDRQLRPSCKLTQPASRTRALPCTPGRTPPPQREAADFDALAQIATRLHDQQLADVVALQEVDGVDAAQRVFRKGWITDCFIKRPHPQKVGFAIRDGTPYVCNGEYIALDHDGHSRAGADITLWPGSPKAIRLLAVHLKSGCFAGKLDRRFGPCSGLREQVPIVEHWIDARVREGMAFAVLGDFNRHLDKDARFPAGPDEDAPINVFQAWSDNQPPGAVLTRATEAAPYLPCDADDTHSQYIDDVLMADKLVRQSRTFRLARQAYGAEWRGRKLSDHCPVGVTLEGLTP